MADKIKNELLKLIDEFEARAPAEKKPWIQQVRQAVETRKIKDNINFYDDGALFLFHLTNGMGMMQEEDKHTLYKYTKDLNSDLTLSSELNERPTKKGSISK